MTGAHCKNNLINSCEKQFQKMLKCMKDSKPHSMQFDLLAKKPACLGVLLCQCPVYTGNPLTQRLSVSRPSGLCTIIVRRGSAQPCEALPRASGTCRGAAGRKRSGLRPAVTRAAECRLVPENKDFESVIHQSHPNLQTNCTVTLL